ncbi:MAG: hypothetical protein C4576_01455 [Desulfobacteraceae bacterium]|nr:MAG: hypothetical protein C4576_01455 [Desulfobacteraceae bacterium]
MGINGKAIERLKALGKSLIEKGKEVNDFAQRAPEISRRLMVSGEYIAYTADELSKADSLGMDFNASVIGVEGLESDIKFLSLPSHEHIQKVLLSSTGVSNTATAIVVDLDRKAPDLELFQNPPESLRIDEETTKITASLNDIKEGLGSSWRSVWDEIKLGSATAIKSACASARTVVDEIGWLVPYDDLVKLEWCKLDEKARPTRASRYAWILHGVILPSELGGNPSADAIWKAFGKSYDELQRFVHLTSITRSERFYVERLLSAIQDGLSEYVSRGFDRLKNAKKNLDDNPSPHPKPKL